MIDYLVATFDVSQPPSFSIHSIGIHQHPGDLEVNAVKRKALTNMRSAKKGITVGFAGVKYLAVAEILEVKPDTVRCAWQRTRTCKSRGHEIDLFSFSTQCESPPFTYR
jgi:predicted membrane GTPase involved in stress response